MFFTSVKEINRLRKEINRLLHKWINRLRKEIKTLLSKGMSNIYLKTTIEKNSCSQNFDFLSLKNQMSRSKTVCGFSNILILKGIMNFKSQSLCILLNKNINFNKNETKLKLEIPHTILERRTCCLSSYKSHIFKVKLLCA